MAGSSNMLVSRPTVIVGLFIQQAIALFVLKTGAGFSIFKWIATLASDFLNQSSAGAQFFFDAETAAKHWFFVSTVRSRINFSVHIADLYKYSSSQPLFSLSPSYR